MPDTRDERNLYQLIFYLGGERRGKREGDTHTHKERERHTHRKKEKERQTDTESDKLN